MTRQPATCFGVVDRGWLDEKKSDRFGSLRHPSGPGTTERTDTRTNGAARCRSSVASLPPHPLPSEASINWVGRPEGRRRGVGRPHIYGPACSGNEILDGGLTTRQPGRHKSGEIDRGDARLRRTRHAGDSRHESRRRGGWSQRGDRSTMPFEGTPGCAREAPVGPATTCSTMPRLLRRTPPAGRGGAAGVRLGIA